MNMRVSNMVAGLLAALWWLAVPATAGGAELKIGDQARVDAGFWTQIWYQYVEDGGVEQNELHDFMARRAYLSLKGTAGSIAEFFTHIAADRVGQEGLDNPGLGLGSGVAFRDLWITLNLNEALKIQAGRMYVPLTRSYGTTSTKALLTTDLPFLQGGVRGSIFYASKVGRDDGIAVWGNPLGGRMQYRLMAAEGVEGADNPDNGPRLAGRVSFSFLEPETGWFNQGSYLGKKNVLSLGAGYDTQHNLILSGVEGQDNRVWTVDTFFDRAVGGGAVTVEAAYLVIDNGTQTHALSGLAAGDDATSGYVQAGYLLPGTIGPGRLQPYARYETVDVDNKGATDFLGAGANWLIRGHDAKLSVDYNTIDPPDGRDRQDIVTIQLAIGL
ncbi:MAG: porin [Sinimarinibacterium sp.]|jgi:hypothetical protein